MLGSHNSWTCYGFKGLGKLLTPWASCQHLSIEEQYAEGVRVFDMRVAFYKNGVILVHNKLKINVSAKQITETLNWLNKQGDVFVRVILDIRNKPKNADKLVTRFKIFLRHLESRFRGIRFYEQRVFWDWNNPLCAEISQSKQVEKHVSVSSKAALLVLGPELWAVEHNSTFRFMFNNFITDDNKILWLDFVEH